MNILEYIDILQEKQKKNYLPSSVVFELTPFCNFHCNMCYVRIDQREETPVLHTEQWISLIKDAASAGVLGIGFTGGEVFTRSDFQIIYETAYDLGLMVTILSNGYLINDDTIKWLSIKKPNKIKITLYGASNETYQKVCGIDKGFTIVTSNIQKLIDAGINVKVCMTVTKENKDDLASVKEYALKNNLNFSWADSIRNPVRGVKREVAHLRVTKALPDLKEQDIVHDGVLFPFQTEEPFSSCRCYKSSCIIGWNGKILGCNFINSITEDALHGDFVTNFRKLWDRLSQLRMPEKCKKCKYLKFCNPCPGVLEPESGDPEMASDYVCDLAKYRYYTRHLKHSNKEEFKNDICE